MCGDESVRRLRGLMRVFESRASLDGQPMAAVPTISADFQDLVARY
jgi:hypothetical protein